MSSVMVCASTREELEFRVVTLRGQGMSRRAIARALEVSRNTVRDILQSHEQRRKQEHCALPTPARNAPRAKLIDTVAPRVSALLVQYPAITAQRVFEILRDEGFGGCYTTVKRQVRHVRPAPKPSPSLTTPVYGPGKMAESDWSPYQVALLNGSTLALQAFAYVLVYSRRKHYAVFARNDLHALMAGHELAFARFEGCAEVCKYDSQKPVVLRWEGTQPIYNPRFLAFATYYEFRPEALRGQPNAKPRVERSFWEFETSFLNGRSFRDIDDFDAQLTHWLDTIADQRLRHRSTPLSRFAEEKEHLVRLPAHPYDTARVVYRLCSIDGFVDWQGNRYAVPYDHITDFLPVRITQKELFVYAADLRCVARHELAARGLGLKIDPAEYHPPARRKSPIDLEQLQITFEQMGPGGTDFARLLSLTPPRHWGRHARQILLLRERYDTADLDDALGHAALYGAFDVRALERILSARCRPRTLDEYVTEQTSQRLSQALGPSRTLARDLTEYDQLPLCGASPAAPSTVTQPKEFAQCPNEIITPSPATSTPSPLTTTCSSSDCADTSSTSG